MTLDIKNKAIGINLVRLGDLSSTIAMPCEVFKLATAKSTLFSL